MRPNTFLSLLARPLILLLALTNAMAWAEGCDEILLDPNLPTRASMPFQIPPSLKRRMREIEPEFRMAETIFERVNYGPRDGQPIVFAGFGKFLGDSIIFTVSQVEAIHRLFPHSRIYLVCKASSLIEPQVWLSPIDSESSPEKIYAATGPDAFWITQRNVHNDFITKAQLNGINLYDEMIFHGADIVTTFVNGQATQHDFGMFWGSDLSGFDGTLYREYDYFSRYFFGLENGFYIPPAFFLRAGGKEAVHKYLQQKFSQSVQTEFAVINLNTFGPLKVKAMTPYYLKNLKLLIGEIRKAHPNLKILLAPPEPQFGKDIYLATTNLVTQLSKKVAFLPSDKKHWQSFVASARFVISQDSGFMHLALAVKSARHIFGIGHEFDISDVATWSMPGQTTDVLLGEKNHALEKWLSEQ